MKYVWLFGLIYILSCFSICILYANDETRMGDRLILRPIQNETGNPEYDWLAEVFEEELRRRLEATGQLLEEDPLYAEPDEEFAGVREITGIISLGDEKEFMINLGLMSGSQHDTYVTHIEQQADVRDFFEAQTELAQQAMDSMNITPQDLVHLAMNKIDVRVEFIATFSPAYIPEGRHITMGVLPFKTVPNNTENDAVSQELYQQLLESLSGLEYIELPDQSIISDIPPEAPDRYSDPTTFFQRMAQGMNLEYILIGRCQYLGDTLLISIEWYEEESQALIPVLSFSIHGNINNTAELLDQLKQGINLAIGQIIQR